MKNIKLDSILIFALLTSFIMTYRISPGNTPYWLFGIIFAGLLSYILLDFPLVSLAEKIKNKLKYMVLWFLILASIGAGFYSSIVVRHQTSPIYGVHDIIIQQESAIRFLLHGVNPYETNYFNTPLKDWHYSDTEINPALYHFVMQPFYLIFAIPFYLISSHVLFGFFDGRIPLFFLFFTLLIFASKLVKEDEKKRLFIILLAFNPATLGYLLEGRDDIFMFAFLFASLYFLQIRKNFMSSVMMAFAFAIKQSVWPIFPFYFVYLYLKNKNLKKTILDLAPFTVVFLIITLPFFFWSPSAFLTSTIFYLSGNAEHSYPIAGYGLGALLKDIGIIKSQYDYYPFWVWQFIISLPVMFWFIKWQQKGNTVKKLIIVYALFLFIFWYFSRYFNNSHLGYISMLFVTAYFWPNNKVD